MKPLKRGSVALGFGLLCLAAGAAMAQPQALPDTIFRQNFEDGELGGWTTMGQTAKISLTREPQYVKEGETALRFDYAVAKGEMNAMLIAAGPVPELAGVKLFHFWIKTDYAAPVVLVLQEQNGGRYIYLFSTPKDKWQPVEVEPSEFILSEGADDPKDPDNKLDLERVEAFAIADFSQLFVQDEKLAKLLDIHTETHTFVVDDLAASTQAPVAPAATSDNIKVLDTSGYPQPSWVGIGGVDLSIDTEMKGRPLQASYRHAPDKFAAIVRRLPRGKLAETQWLSFNIASLKPITLIVQVEEIGGGKYNSTVMIPGNVEPFEAKLEWKNFTPADDSKDDNNRLDLEQVNQLLILDATGFLELDADPNTFWLSNLRAGR